MTPKEKAIELYYKFYNQLSFDLTDEFNDKCAKQCALIAVDEILEAIPNEYLDYWQGESQMILNEDVDYWKEVKQEIEKL